MSKYYTPRRTRNLYQPGASQPFQVSRSKIDLFVECPRCFYLDRRLGVARPPGFPFALNSAVDKLLKSEFDAHRASGEPHPLIEKYGVKARPATEEKLSEWRENFVGIQYLHQPTNLLISGAIDDLWINPEGEYIVVDYKSTSKGEEITQLDKDWHEGYKRQMEVYQWLLRRNGYPVAKKGYFVYCNGLADKEAFDAKLEFDITLIGYDGDDSWVEPKLAEIKTVLEGEAIPPAGAECDYCPYREAVKEEEAQKKD